MKRVSFVFLMSFIFSNFANAASNYLCDGNPGNVVFQVTQDSVTPLVSNDDELNKYLTSLGLPISTSIDRSRYECTVGFCVTAFVDVDNERILIQFTSEDRSQILHNQVFSCQELN